MKKYNVMVKMPKKCEGCGDLKFFEWLPVRPTHGQPYEWSKEEAEKYVETYSFGRESRNLKIQEI